MPEINRETTKMLHIPFGTHQTPEKAPRQHLKDSGSLPDSAWKLLRHPVGLPEHAGGPHCGSRGGLWRGQGSPGGVDANKRSLWSFKNNGYLNITTYPNRGI